MVSLFINVLDFDGTSLFVNTFQQYFARKPTMVCFQMDAFDDPRPGLTLLMILCTDKCRTRIRVYQVG